MSRKNSRDRQSHTRKSNNVSFTVSSAQTPKEVRDFGLLKIRTAKIKQSTTIIKDGSNVTNFSRMDNERLIQIIEGTDLTQIRALSRWYAQKDGIYSRAVRYIADLYRFDFMLYPNIDLEDELKETHIKKILKQFNIILEHFDGSSIQQMCRRWANEVCLVGAYYGYICDDVNDQLVIQDLPINYCRTRFLHRGKPLIEFNVEFFDKVTRDEKYREQLLNLFPDEFKVGYKKFLQGKLQAETRGDNPGWILLDTKRAFRFCFYENEIPPFLSAIPALLELDEVQDLEKEKLLQQIQKILVQKFELDKNGQIPFTMVELQKLNQNAIDMVGDAVGVSVLSTVAEVHLEDMAPESTGSEAVKSVGAASDTVYSELGISTNLFNTTGNLAMEKSIITDEGFVKPLMLQFESFFNFYITWKFNKKDNKFRMKMLGTTIFNYQTLSDKYKDLTKIGFSRFLPMIALGHTQKEVVSLAKLEQQIMELDAFMLPPFSSNTMSSDTWNDIKLLQKDLLEKKKPGEPGGLEDPENKGGRPQLPGDQKSDKTLANQAALN